MLLILLILFFFITFFLPLYIRVEYQRKGEDDSFILDVYILIKILGFRIKVPYLQNKVFKFFSEIVTEIDSTLLNLWPWKNELEIEREIDWRNIQLKRLKKIVKILSDREMTSLIFNSINLRCWEFIWETDFGWPNPALTGVTNGFIWTLKGIIIRLVDSKIHFLKEPDLAVYPDFYHKKFSTRFKGIFSLYLGNIILTVIRVLIYKLKGGYRPWENIQLKN
ncbi:MAG: hypothetical protein PWR10_313 [Halanaerobiales bacterium]|nr:hypothetical protein [Halanaerobiales bacterium]